MSRLTLMATCWAGFVVFGCATGEGPVAPATQHDAGPETAPVDGPSNDSSDASAALDATTSDGAVHDGGDDACVDLCPAPLGGVTWGCQRRFMYGVNYAWWHFGADFGGLADWGQGGVAAVASTHAANLKEMRDHGASVIRWWVFPDFRGDGISFNNNETVNGLGTTTLTDVTQALALAEEADVYLMLCLFSFDAFHPSQEVAGVWVPGIKPMLDSGTKRQALLNHAVRPLARAVAESPYAHRMIAWDVINEPEWAITGASPYGDEDYTPAEGLESVTHGTMEGFIADVITALRAESSALITVGAAAFKWAHAWKNLGTDFHQFHMYAWINDWWPYTLSPTQLELSDKPLVMGELPMGDLDTGIPYGDVLTSWWGNGYSGALSWQYIEASQAELDNVASFAAEHTCETSYGAPYVTTMLPPAPVAPAPVVTPGTTRTTPAARPVAPPSRRRCHRGPDGIPVCGRLP